MRVFERVKQYIDKNGITQRELSERTNIPETTLSLILRGGRKFECDEFELIVQALGVPASEFIKPGIKKSA